MSIKDRGKKYVEFLDFLRKEYIAKYGKEAEGLADTMLKRKAAEKVDEMMKVIPFPEGKITDWTKDRPTTGPKADVKTFPKEKKLTPETEGLGSFDKLKKELEEMEKLGQPYKDTSVSDFMSDYFDMPQKAPPKRNITELNNVKLYGDETFEELQVIKDTGKHPRNKAAGGRIGFKFGTGKRSKNVKQIMDEVNKKLGTKTTGGEVKLSVDIPESPKAELQRMFDEFNQRFKKKTRSSKKEYERLKDEEPERMAEYDAMWSDEEPVQMSMEDLIEFRSQNPAGKGRFTRAEAIIARLENTIQDAKNNPDETSDYVLTNFPNMIEELKNKPELANNENVWKELGMTGLPENQRFKLYDDGTVDFETLKPTHQFKLREDIKRKLNAEGGLNYLMGL
jgi:hypothetical protein